MRLTPTLTGLAALALSAGVAAPHSPASATATAELTGPASTAIGRTGPTGSGATAGGPASDLAATGSTDAAAGPAPRGPIVSADHARVGEDAPGAGRVAVVLPGRDEVTVGSGGAPSTCRGMPADVVRAGDDYVGTEGDDVVLVLGPPSEVHAHGGDDLVCVHGSHSQPDWATTVHAGEGDDVVWGLSGALFAWGNDGDDVLLGNGTSMTFGGEDGNDVVNAAGAASAWVHGGTGHDWVTGSPGADEVWGGEGNDLVFGWDGADSIDGESGNDELYGGHGPDELDGGPGTDDCHDHASAAEGATLTSCEFPHLVPVTPDDITFG